MCRPDYVFVCSNITYFRTPLRTIQSGESGGAEHPVVHADDMIAGADGWRNLVGFDDHFCGPDRKPSLSFVQPFCPRGSCHALVMPAAPTPPAWLAKGRTTEFFAAA